MANKTKAVEVAKSSLTKTGLVEFMANVAKEEGLKGASKKAAAVYYDAFVQGVATALAVGDNVELNGFINIEVIPVPEHEARNPQTGETVTVAEGFKLRTRAMSKLQSAIGR